MRIPKLGWYTVLVETPQISIEFDRETNDDMTQWSLDFFTGKRNICIYLRWGD